MRLIVWDRSEDPALFDITSMPSQYTWMVDQALPGKHTLQLYGSLTSDQALILIQARTGHCRLNQGLVESAKCRCGDDEERVRNFTPSCPQWA